MAGKAILTCRPNSHPFQERTLSLEQPVKIGRSVARARSTPTNAIFDCKVLSRNHAVFWYANGKFYLQDTKSSNGTFVNNQRLSKSGEESAPREVCSGDIVQFGVDVLENARKVTHGSIVANLKLYLPDGKEAKPSHSALTSNSLPVEDLYQLNQYIQEAIHREQMLENKLFTLQSVLDNVRQATDQGWKTLIAEDRLLSRVEILENQLQTYAKSFPEDKQRDELRRLLEDKNQYQSTAKEFLKKILEEKLDAVQKCQELKRSLINVETEYSNACEQSAKYQRDIQDLAQKLSSELAKNEETKEKIMEIEDQHKEKVDRLEAKVLELETVLLKQHATEASLEKQVSELEVAENLAKERASFYEFQLKALNKSIFSSEVYIDKSEKEKTVSDRKDKDDQMSDCLEEKLKKEEVLELYSAQLSLLQKENFSQKSLQYDIMDASYEDSWNSFPKTELSSEINIEEKSSNFDNLQLIELVQNSNTDPPLLNTVELNDLSLEEKAVEDCESESLVGKSLREEMILNDVNIDEKHIAKNEVLLEPEESIVKIQKAHQDIEEWQSDPLSSDSLMSESTKSQEVITTSLIDDKNQKLKSQLIEAQQLAKQRGKEALQMAARVKSLMSELEARNQVLDNKTKDELDKKIAECSQLQSTISTLQNQILCLKEECSSLQTEKELWKKSGLELQLNSISPIQLKELQTKVQELQEELVIIGTKYMNCNEERTKLNCELNRLTLDYQAVTQLPYFNLVFALPCFVLFVAFISTFYPTLSHFTGTSDNTQH